MRERSLYADLPLLREALGEIVDLAAQDSLEIATLAALLLRLPARTRSS
jgi:hypothetical protein